MITEDVSTSYSVIIPVRASDPFLGQAIDSILSQSLPPEKVLVMVNGTTNPTCSSIVVARGFSSVVEPYLIAEKGIIPAVNAGIGLVTTEFVAFLDSDDLWLADKQKQQISALLSFPSVDGVGCLVSNFSERPDGVRDILLTAPAAVMGATTFRKQVFNRFGMLDLRSSSTGYWFRWFSSATAKGLSMINTNEVGLLRRVHDTNIWVTEKELGLANLHKELRQILHNKRSNGEI